MIATTGRDESLPYLSSEQLARLRARLAQEPGTPAPGSIEYLMLLALDTYPLTARSTTRADVELKVLGRGQAVDPAKLTEAWRRITELANAERIEDGDTLLDGANLSTVRALLEERNSKINGNPTPKQRCEFSVLETLTLGSPNLTFGQAYQVLIQRVGPDTAGNWRALLTELINELRHHLRR